MGYNTDFKGTLLFQKELKASQIVKLQTILGEDCREHPEWKAQDMAYIDLELTKDFSGLVWSESEKTYEMEEKIGLIIRLMCEEWPDFQGLKGKFLCQGEDIEDRYEIIVNGDSVTKHETPHEGMIVECPHCGEKFVYDAPSV